MTLKENNNSDPPETVQEYKLIEFYDYFYNQKNKKNNLKNYGEKSAHLNNFFFDYFKGYNIPVAFEKKESKKKLQLLKTDEFPFRVTIINNADSRTAKLFPIKAGTPLQLPIIEYHYGDSRDSLVTESHIISFNLCTYDELKFINRLCSKLNAIVKSFFERRNAVLVELTCIFGKFDSKIYLVGDFSPLCLKVIDIEYDAKKPDPYKIETSVQMRKYTDYLFKLINGE